LTRKESPAARFISPQKAKIALSGDPVIANEQKKGPTFWADKRLGG
jgi:hypothetical protein